MATSNLLTVVLCRLSVETCRYSDLQKAGVSQFIESMTQLLSRLLEFRWLYLFG